MAELTDEQIDQAFSAITTAIGHVPTCPMCGHDMFSVEAQPTALFIAKSSSLIGSTGYSVLSLSCDQCRYVMLFRMDKLGIEFE